MDIASYRLSERMASATLPSWRLKALHNPHIFVSAGFPVRVESTDELVGLLDTMQENRFPLFLKELGGLDDKDLSVLVKAVADYCLFFQTHFQSDEVPLPLSTMMAHLVLAKKLRGLGPRRILELGPGCGYLSFFLRDWEGLANYTQVETTESFYLLQNLVNKYLFGARFKDHAQAQLNGHAASLITQALPGNETELSPRLKVEVPAVCHHYPWWQAGAAAKERFDVVTANAMLNELSESAFRQYVWLIDQCLAPDGALLVQCIGGGPLPFDLIFRALAQIRLAPVVMYLGSGEVGDKFFTLPNMLFVRQGHPLFAKYAKDTINLPLFDTKDLLVRTVYLYGREGRRDVTMREIATKVAERLQRA